MNIKTNLKNKLAFNCFKTGKNCVWFCIFALLSLLVMAIIFWFSHQTAEQSALISDGLSGAILDKLDPVESQQKAINFVILRIIIRKFAHFVLFTVLGVFLAGAAVNLNTKKQFGKFATISAIGIVYGAFDEVHQLFISGRSSEFLDVALDFFGVIVGIVFTLLTLKIIQIIAKKRKKI